MKAFQRLWVKSAPFPIKFSEHSGHWFHDGHRVVTLCIEMEYVKQFMCVIGTIGKHGNAVIMGRGANFVLPPERILGA